MIRAAPAPPLYKDFNQSCHAMKRQIARDSEGTGAENCLGHEPGR